MGGQTGTPTTLLRMETCQHILHVLEDGSTRSQLLTHHPQPSLDAPSIQVSRTWLGLEEGLAHSPLGPTLNGDHDIPSRAHSQIV